LSLASAVPPKEQLATLEPQVELTAESLWAEVSGRLKGALNETTYRTWFADVDGQELSDDDFVLGVPNDFAREWIEGHFLGLIKAAVRDATGHERRVELRVLETGAAETAQVQIPVPPRRTESGLNPKYVFDLFVIGSSNRFAHAAALAVAEAPAQAYNPLFIYGGTGLGKTHLMQAIAQYVAQHSGDLSVKYVTSETFMNDFINSLRDKRIEGFKQRYRTYDLLLVDDVQFFEHKERIQEEFFHTFNSLYEAGSQIVMSSDRPPREISTLEERLRSRFEWGLITDIQPPDLETRIAILRKKVKTDGIHVPDPQVLTFIASRIETNIRELEGALTRVVAFSSLTGPPDDRRARTGSLERRLPAGRGGGGLDSPDSRDRLRPVQPLAERAHRREALPEHRLPATGRDVPLARADRLLAAEDREGVRRPRPHDGHPRDLEDRAPDP
jgi:chromosomal replication initiator protein